MGGVYTGPIARPFGVLGRGRAERARRAGARAAGPAIRPFCEAIFQFDDGSRSFARASGFQFDFVVSTNERAVRLWEHAGFERVGVLPKAFRHPTLGLVDAFVMHRFL